jgi:hypothetical protein
MANLPKVQNAQYGDSAKLEQLGAGRLTNNPAASVQEWKDPTGGRPPETDPVKLATRQMQPGKAKGQQSPEQAHYQRKFDTLAELHGKVQDWITIANNPAAGRVTRGYAIAAIESYKRILKNTRKTTPFWD